MQSRDFWRDPRAIRTHALRGEERRRVLQTYTQAGTARHGMARPTLPTGDATVFQTISWAWVKNGTRLDRKVGCKTPGAGPRRVKQIEEAAVR